MRTVTRAFIVGILLAAACGPSKRQMGDDELFPDAAVDAPCNTSISGKVFAPNGTLPLYNVTVYVPMSPPGPLQEGVTCGQCSTSLPGGSIAQARSDAEGKFVLDNVPPGTDVPIVIMTGKWRRQLTVPLVAKCVDNPIMDGVFRLPKNRSEGDIPRIAMVTGGCDELACIFSKIGLDASEFGDSSSGAQRVVWYNGDLGVAPGSPQPAQALWGNLDELKKFDMVINSCECGENNGNKNDTDSTTPGQKPQILRQYADMGGRVFGSHFHYTWTRHLIPEWQTTADWSPPFSGATPDLVDMSHPDGMALAEWLVAVGGSTTMGQIALGDKKPNAGTVVPPTTRWLHSSGETTHYLSFKTPVGVPQEQQCGKVVYAGMHVASGTVNASFPSGCSGSLTPDEKALVFLLFDLGSCVDIIF